MVFFLCFLYPFLFVFLFGAGVFNFWCECVSFGEVGFDSPTKLVSGGPRFMVDPTLRHCTFSHGLD